MAETALTAALNDFMAAYDTLTMEVLQLVASSGQANPEMQIVADRLVAGKGTLQTLGQQVHDANNPPLP
jgi:hypothetical protein